MMLASPSSFSPRSEERPSTDGRAGTTDRISARTSPFYLLVDLCAESLLLHGRSTIPKPRCDSGVRELLSPLLSPSRPAFLPSRMSRGVLLPSSSCDPAGRYLGTTGHPGGPLTRHDRPWDTGRNAPRSKRRASDLRSSIFSTRTRPPRCFRVIRRETTTGFWTVGGLPRWYRLVL